ncbi:MAG: DUF2281 domain-containing protein [bacterium]
MFQNQTAEELIKELPPELKEKVIEYIQLLIKNNLPKHGKKLRQDWGGGLREYREKYTSLELQKKALEWREK